MNPVNLLDLRVATAFYGRFQNLRPAQEAAIEPLINGQNVVLSSGTGSGKTEAVVAPLLSRFWRIGVDTDSLIILYIVPTKALVNDLEKRLYPILSTIGLRVGIRHGDRDDLVSGSPPHLLITTPESLDVLLFRKDISLNEIKAVIIDEVHLLYNTQRGLQLSILLHRLKRVINHQFQWAALSATMGNLSHVRDFLFGHDDNTIFLQYSAHRSIDAKVLSVNDETNFLELIKKIVKGSPKKLLLFANSRRECDRLASILNQDKQIASEVFAHYSSLSSEVRNETERSFAASKTAICVATSTLELGIDIGDIDAVLLWGVPSSVESFLQRIGRSNRRQNKTNVICLIPDQSDDIIGDALRFLTLINTAKQGELPIRTPYALFGAVGQQFLSVIAAENGRFTRVADLCELVTHKNYLDREAVEAILSELAKNSYLQPHGFKNQFGADQRLYELQDYRMIYGNFPAASQTIDVFYKSKLLGSVPSTNLLRLRRQDVVNFAGKRWQVRSMSIDGIFVEPTGARRNTIDFVYPGAGPGFDSFLAGKMWQLLHSEVFPDDTLSVSLRELVNKAKKQFCQLCSTNQVPFTLSQQGIRYFTFAGYLTNKAIALITEKTFYKADDISLLVNSPIDWEIIPTKPEEYAAIFHLLFEANSEQSVYQAVLPLEFQREEFLQDWLKDESVKQSLSRLTNSSVIQYLPDNADLPLFGR